MHASLIARLDRLGPHRQGNRRKSALCIGREFGYDLIEQVARSAGRPSCERGSTGSPRPGSLFCRGAPPHSSYLFKHALVQDAAYGTLLRARRQELHARVAAMLEQHFADLVDRQPELLAHHLTAAADPDRAVDQWLKAGQYAAQRLGPSRSDRPFRARPCDLAGARPSTGRDRREIELQLARGLSLFTTEGFVSDAAG